MAIANHIRYCRYETFSSLCVFVEKQLVWNFGGPWSFHLYDYNENYSFTLFLKK